MTYVYLFMYFHEHLVETDNKPLFLPSFLPVISFFLLITGSFPSFSLSFKWYSLKRGHSVKLKSGFATQDSICCKAAWVEKDGNQRWFLLPAMSPCLHMSSDTWRYFLFYYLPCYNLITQQCNFHTAPWDRPLLSPKKTKYFCLSQTR